MLLTWKLFCKKTVILSTTPQVPLRSCLAMDRRRSSALSSETKHRPSSLLNLLPLAPAYCQPIIWHLRVIFSVFTISHTNKAEDRHWPHTVYHSTQFPPVSAPEFWFCSSLLNDHLIDIALPKSEVPFRDHGEIELHLNI